MMEGIMMRYLLACFTDKGKRKGVNQDSLFVSRANWQGQEVVLAVICDGMGGLDRGELASGKVVRAFAGWFRERFLSVARQEEFEDELYESWEILFQNLHREIKEYGERQGIRTGTTATAMLFWQERFFIAHVGDCRIYEIKEQVRQLTKDQVWGELRRDGRNGVDELGGVKEGTHILLQGVGVSKAVRPVYHSGEVKKDAVYLLCTDGFRHKVSAEELRQEFRPEELLDEAVMRRQGERVARTVIERGEKDNMSVILLRTIWGQEQGEIPDECCSREYTQGYTVMHARRAGELRPLRYIIEKEMIVSDGISKGI